MTGFRLNFRQMFRTASNKNDLNAIRDAFKNCFISSLFQKSLKLIYALAGSFALWPVLVSHCGSNVIIFTIVFLVLNLELSKPNPVRTGNGLEFKI
jgi:hypothetical protein